jgi:nucleoside-diphosphate-sugar epimerase
MTVWGVTGATGFIGRHLVRRLLDRGDQVVALVRPGGDAGLLPEAVERRVTALDDRQAVEDALAGVEICAHLAAPRRTLLHDRDAAVAAAWNEARLTAAPGIVTLLEAGARTGLRRFVLASSAAVFGHPWQTVTEHTPPNPDTSYGRERLAAELMVAEVASRLGIEACVLRLSEVFGPGSVGHAALFLEIARGHVRVPGDGGHSHQLIFVTDAVRALEAAGVHPRAAGQMVVVSGPSLTLREWLDGIASAAGVRIRYLPVAGPPGRLALRALTGVPWSRSPSWRQRWDYFLRPRAYDLGPSEHALGAYNGSSSAQSIEATLNWYRMHAAAS